MFSPTSRELKLRSNALKRHNFQLCCAPSTLGARCICGVEFQRCVLLTFMPGVFKYNDELYARQKTMRVDMVMMGDGDDGK